MEEEKGEDMVESVEVVLERIEVMHKGDTKIFRCFGEAIDYAKKVTQFEDEYSHAYIVRKVKVRNIPHKTYIYSVTWVEGSMWLVSDML